MQKHLSSIDGLRALSISFVILGHLSNSDQLRSHFHATSLGQDGVLIFFCLSGFLITSNLLNEKLRTGTVAFTSFITQRAFRLFPAAASLIAAMLLLSSMGIVVLTKSDVVHALTYTVDFQIKPSITLMHLWSLSIEEQFYLIWPLAFIRSRLKHVPLFALGAVLLGPVSHAISWHVAGPSLPAVRIFTNFADVIAIGSLLAIYQDKLPRLLRSSLVWIVSMIGILLCGLIASRAVGFIVVQPTLTGLLSALLINALTDQTLSISKLLSYPPVAWLGTLSYSLYLWQQVFTTPDKHTLLWTIPWSLIATLATACTSYYLIEQPIRKWGRRFRPTSKSTGCVRVQAA